jgi:hypothetical protein
VSDSQWVGLEGLSAPLTRTVDAYTGTVQTLRDDADYWRGKYLEVLGENESLRCRVQELEAGQ